MWMYRALYALMLMTLSVVAISFSTGEVISVDQKTGDLHEDVKTFDHFILAACFTALKYFVMIGLYVQIICFIYGAVTFVPPAGTWPGETFPPHAEVVACTMIMASMTFLVYAEVHFREDKSSSQAPCT